MKNRTYCRLDRRFMLRSAGATIALPWLDCMAAEKSGSERSPSTPPKRSVFIYIPNGVNTLTWQIERAGEGYQFPNTQASLERHRAEVTPISGLHHPMVLGKHHNCDRVWLTGANVPADGGAFRNSVSADQLIAEVQGEETRLASLEVAINGGSLAWTREGIQLPAEQRPSAIFDRLFGVPAGGVDAEAKMLRRKQSVLDTVLADSKKLTKRVGKSDQSKLDEYFTAVRQVEQAARRAESWLDVPKPEVEERLRDRLTKTIDTKEAGEYYRTVYELIVLALQTDTTRVITYMTGTESNGLAIPEIGITQTRHELSHHNGDPEQLRRLTATDTFLVEQFSAFLDQLATHREGDERLLDRTQILWGSGMAYGHSHGNANLPLIMAGGKSLGWRHGSHLDFNLRKIDRYDLMDAKSHYGICTRPVDPNARLSNLLLTMLHAADVNAEAFQGSVAAIGDVFRKV